MIHPIVKAKIALERKNLNGFTQAFTPITSGVLAAIRTMHTTAAPTQAAPK